MELIGKILAGRYEIIEKIGEGGMAYVFKARDNLLNRYVAVKVLKDEYAKDELFVKRFRAEAQSAASLIHPNIVSVFDVGEDKTVSYIVMELLESKTLKDYIEEKGVLSSEITLKLAAQIASALQAAHKTHIVHRDIKPQNIILNQNLVAKVTDFGIAKVSNNTSETITSFGKTMGSVHYFSPEHAKGGYTDAKSDLYSLGVVMYEMATGKLPFDAESPVSVALKHIQDDPIEPSELNPKIENALNQIIMKCLEKSTATRYQSAMEVLTDISIALNEPSTSLVSRPATSIEAGATQIIPTLDDENLIPNVRTRQPGVRSAYTPIREDRDSNGNVEVNDNGNTKKKSKLTKKAKIIIALFTVLILVVGSFSVFKIYQVVRNKNQQNTEIEIPNILGKDFEEIKKELEKQGITVSQTASDYKDGYKEGEIYSQNPVAGTKTKTKRIYVEVSKGTKMVKVPNVEGKDFKVAKYELEDTWGFIIEREDVVSDTIASGVIISQEFKDIEKPHGSVIKIKVSKGDGRDTIVVPSVVGKTSAEAKSELEALKLSVKITYGEDDTKSNGIVLKQSFPQNSTLKDGDLIEITVNRRIVNKTVTVKGIPAGTAQNDIRVSVSVDGGASNTTTFIYESDNNQLTFRVNGYEKVNYSVYVKDDLIRSGEENF